MISLDVTADVQAVERMLHRLNSREVRRGAAVALNRTITTVRKEAVKDLKEVVGTELGLGAGGLKKSIKMFRASARLGGLIAKLVPSGRAIPLINFKARPTKTGVSHSAWGKRQIAKGAFIRKMPGGHKGVFRRLPAQFMSRRTAGRPATSSPNLAIKEMWGPSLPREFVRKRVMSGMQSIARRHWPKNFTNEMKFRIKKILK